MAEQVPFINREVELGRIEALIEERGTRRVLCIQAPGGIGKTRLLQEVQERHAEDAHIIGIIDFDDLALRIPRNVELAIVRQLGSAVLDPYLQSLQEYYRMRGEGVSPGRLAQKSLDVQQAFIEGFNRLSGQRRVVLLLDTTDALGGTDVWNYIVHTLSCCLENVLLIAAGRNASKIYEELRSKIGKDARCIELSPLDAAASKLYLDQKQELRHITLEPRLAQKLLLLAGGRPILIDLAVEWLARDIPLDWLVASDLQDLKSLPDDERERRQMEFEARVVQHIAELRASMDRLTLLMSRVYPLDVDMIAEMLKIPDDEAQALFTDAGTYVFVKLLPDGRITLHDEMRRMVNEYVWPEADPDGSRRRRDSQMAVECLDHQARALQAQLAQSEDEGPSLHLEEHVEPIMAPFSQREVLRQRLWTLQARALRHRMYLDPHKGFVEFDRLFQEAFNRRDVDLCVMLVETAREYQDSLSTEDQVRLALNEDMLPVLKGELKTALDRIPERLRALEELQVTKDLDRAYNALGYCYRLQGEWELAIASYERALQYGKKEKWGEEEGDARQIAETMNNIANVCRFNGDFEQGLRYTKASLKIRERLDDRLAIANSCYVRGMILWEIGNAAEAAAYLKRARRLYEELNDEIRVAWVDKYTGYFHYRIGDVQVATEYLEQAMAVFRERDVKGDLADALNMLSRVTRRRNVTGRAQDAVFEQAGEYALEGLRIAREIGDHYKTAECLLSLCALYYRWAQEHRIRAEQHRAHGRRRQATQHEERARHYLQEFRRRYDEGFPIAHDGHHVDLLSVYHMFAGNMAYDLGMLAYQSGDEASARRRWGDALGHYLEECRISAAYKPMRFDRALHEIASRLVKLPAAELTHEYCNRLAEKWRKQGLDQSHPGLIAECEQIKAFLDAPERAVVSHLSEAQADLLTMGDWPRTVETGQRVLEHNRIYLRNPALVRALNANAFALRQLGHFSEARRLCTQSLHLADKLLERARQQAPAVPGDSEATEPLGGEDEKIAEAQLVAAESHYVMGTIHWIVGNTAEASTHLRVARELFEDESLKLHEPGSELRRVVGAARVHRYQGFLYYRIGNLDRALELLGQARRCFEAHGPIADLAEALAVEGRIQFEAGRYERAKENAVRANELARRVGNDYLVAETLINLYNVYSYEGRNAQQAGDQETAARCLDLGRESLREGAKIARSSGYDLLTSVFEKIAGDIAFDAGRLGRAFEHYVSALAYGASFEYARLHRTLDPCVDRLVQLPVDQIRYYADYVIREWKARGLDARFPDVVNTFELIKEYREYVSQA